MLYCLLTAMVSWLMQSRTHVERYLLDMVAGFKMSLATAEERLMESLCPQEHDEQQEPPIKLYKRLLPYAHALALYTAQTWCSRFDAMLNDIRYKAPREDDQLLLDVNDFSRAMSMTSRIAHNQRLTDWLGRGGGVGGGFSGGW